MPELARALAGPPPPEVPLSAAPLSRVVAQVRFPPELALISSEVVAQFQERLRKQYPILSEERQHHVQMHATGPQVREEVVWRLSDRKRDWRVTLAVDFLALETSRYTSRDEFVSRFATAVDAMAQLVAPEELSRVGMRYINRISSQPADVVLTLFEPGVLSLFTCDLEAATEHYVSETAVRCDEGRAMIRSAFLPPGATPDPSSIEPSEQPSWLLDIDVFTVAPQSFDPALIRESLLALAKREYAVFRSLVTPRFLTTFGAT